MADAPQNIYDDPDLFAGYRDLRARDSGLNGALEVPALPRLLPGLAGSDVLDLGCGFVLAHLGEPMPTFEDIAARPQLESDVRRPPFLLLMATRPA